MECKLIKLLFISIVNDNYESIVRIMIIFDVDKHAHHSIQSNVYFDYFNHASNLFCIKEEDKKYEKIGNINSLKIGYEKCYKKIFDLMNNFVQY